MIEKDSISIRDLHGKLIRRIRPREDGLLRGIYYRMLRMFGIHEDRLHNPYGVAVCNDGEMFVTDVDSHRLFKLSCDGTFKAAGGRGEDPGQFDHPYGITLISNKLFVCDRNNYRVQVYDTDLNFLDSFGTRGSGEGEFSPSDISTDRDGCLYVTDYANGCVQVFQFSQSDSFPRSFSVSFLRSFSKRGRGPGELSKPGSIHVHNEHVYITEWGSPRVSVFTTSGEFASSFTVGQSRCVRGITTDRDGYLYVCDPRSGCICIH